MFTGIVTDVGRITEVIPRNEIRRITIESAYDPETIAIGASIACAGVCFTVVDRYAANGGCRFAVEAAPETLALTTAADWAEGTRLNLERSLRVGDELGGHLVTGHIDGVALVAEREDSVATARMVFQPPVGLSRFIAAKGSVMLDGTSLTVNRVSGIHFECLLIPHTLAVTTWAERKQGDKVNLEVDMMARYVARLREGN
jgi:riboflavin synthase